MLFVVLLICLLVGRWSLMDLCVGCKLLVVIDVLVGVVVVCVGGCLVIV